MGDFKFNNVYTIDKVQGMEKEVIIISLVKVKDGKTKILSNMPRLNVAITRAKSKLILIGDMESLLKVDELCKIVQYMRDNKKVVEVPENYIFNF